MATPRTRLRPDLDTYGRPTGPFIPASSACFKGACFVPVSDLPLDPNSVHFGYRDYSPLPGRWIETDSAGYVEDATAYPIVNAPEAEGMMWDGPASQQ